MMTARKTTSKSNYWCCPAVVVGVDLPWVIGALVVVMDKIMLIHFDNNFAMRK